MRHYSHSCPRSLSCDDLVGLHEQLHAVRTDDPHFLGAPDDGAALGTYPPPGTALGFGRFRCAGLTAAGCLAACSGACHIYEAVCARMQQENAMSDTPGVVKNPEGDTDPVE